MAIALLSFKGSIWSINTLSLLIWGYSIRFLAVSKGGLDAGLERISPNIDNAARNLGKSWPEVLCKIHLPLLKGPMLVGALLVFVDTIKELPLTGESLSEVQCAICLCDLQDEIWRIVNPCEHYFHKEFRQNDDLV